MSLRREDHNETFEIYVNGTLTFEINMKNANGDTLSLSNAALYSTGVVQIIRPDGTQIGDDMTISILDRPNGRIEFIVPTTITTPENAGNWSARLVLYNNEETPQIIEQQLFNFNILAAY